MRNVWPSPPQSRHGLVMLTRLSLTTSQSIAVEFVSVCVSVAVDQTAKSVVQLGCSETLHIDAQSIERHAYVSHSALVLCLHEFLTMTPVPQPMADVA